MSPTTKKNKTSDKKKSNSIKKNATKNKKKSYQRLKYTEQALQEAILQVNCGALSANKASIEYCIPKGTLIKKLHENILTIGKMGPKPVLTVEEENMIKKWILDKASIGYPMHPQIVKNAIKTVLDKAPRPNPFANNLPGNKWLKLFLKRHPEIGMKNTEVLSKSRASVTEEQIRQWFKDLETYLAKENCLDILSDPSRIYNLDETGMQLCPKTGKLLGAKKEKNTYAISPGQEKGNMTVLCCYSAEGKSVSPMIVYPYKRFPPQDVAASVPDGYVIGHSPSGWMTIDTYNTYIKTCFHKVLIERGVQFPVILFFDGHSSHISLSLHEFCVENGILLYCLYPNATHIMQPCDVGIFRPLKKSWQKQVALHSQRSNKSITRVNFAPLFHVAYEEACVPGVIKKAFECCGLYPYNPDRIDYSKCMSQRHKLLKVNNDVQESNEVREITSDSMLLSLEKDIPQPILNQFLIAYEADTEPLTEVILFNVWKKYKNKAGQISINSVLDSPLQNHSDTLDDILIAHVMQDPQNPHIEIEYIDTDPNGENSHVFTDKSINSFEISQCGKEVTPESQINNVISTDLHKDLREEVIPVINRSVNSVNVISTQETNDVQNVQVIENITNLNSVMQSNNIPCPSVTDKVDLFVNQFETICVPSKTADMSALHSHSGERNYSSNTVTVSSLISQSKCTSLQTKCNSSSIDELRNVPTPLYHAKVDSPMNQFQNELILPDCKQINSQVLPSKDEDHYYNTNIVEKAIDIKSDEILAPSHSPTDITDTVVQACSKKSLADIWKEELHFPKLEVKKKRKVVKKEPIFAITSVEYKREQEIKIKREEELKRQRELKKFEREVKKKIKIEDEENKKKLMRIRKELQLKNKLEKEEKKAQIALLVKQKAESLGLKDEFKKASNCTINSIEKRNALTNIENFKTD